MNHIIKEKQKKQSEEHFEPIPLYVPQFDMPAYEREDEELKRNAEKEKDSERGVWITEI